MRGVAVDAPCALWAVRGFAVGKTHLNLALPRGFKADSIDIL